MVRALLLTFVLLAAFKAHALEVRTDCSDLPVLQKAWEERYYSDFFEANKNAPPKLECKGNSQNKPYVLAKTLWFIENAKTDVAGLYYQKAKKLVNRIGVDPMLAFEGHGCALADKINVGLITLFGCFFEGDSASSEAFNFIYRASIFIHEVRHIELGNSSKHIKCNNGKECDGYHSEDANTALPYSYEVIYLKDILRNNDFSPEIQKAIKSNIRVTMENHFPKTNSPRQRSSSVSR